MCGRYSLGVDTDRLIAEFGLAVLTADHTPRYNIAPTQDVPAVVRGPDGLRLGALRWGFVPAHAPDPAVGSRMINARSETVDRRPAFAESFRQRRCWVLADGFYEWRRDDDGVARPFHVRLPDGRPFAFAGLWDRWSGPDTEILSCAILTTRPNAAMRALHDRMPVILTPETRDTWLDPTASPSRLSALLDPYPGPLEIRPVSSRVNTPVNDDPSCIEPIPGPD